MRPEVTAPHAFATWRVRVRVLLASNDRNALQEEVREATKNGHTALTRALVHGRDKCQERLLRVEACAGLGMDFGAGLRPRLHPHGRTLGKSLCMRRLHGKHSRPVPPPPPATGLRAAPLDRQAADVG